MIDPLENTDANEDPLVAFYDADFSICDLLNVDRYIDRELIDEGAIKKVYKVTDTHCSREVAFARIKEGVLSLASSIDFVREVQTTSGFEHPNILRVYDVGIENGVPWFTMELSSGSTLRELMDGSEDWSLADRLELFVQLCDALAYAHQHDVLHLDLKPENVNIGKSGQVLLADWGLSSSSCILPEADLLKGQTQSGLIKGSLGYMAPEQAMPNYRKAPPADIFGLGGILHFLLTREAPVKGSSRAAILANTRAGVIRSLKREEIPTRLVPLLDKALSKNPEDRYGSVEKLQSDIEAFRGGFATLAESASTWTKLCLFYRRNQAFCLIVLAAICLLLSSTGYYIHSIKQNEAIANDARVDAENQKAEAVLQRKKANEQRALVEDALAKFVEAEKRTVSINEDFARNLFRNAEDQLMSLDFRRALLSARESIKRDPNTREALRRLGVIHFVRQEFGEAVYYLKASQWSKIQDLIELAEAQEGKTHPLPVADLSRVIDQVSENRPFLGVYLLNYDAEIRGVKGHRYVVADMLRRNAGLKTLQFSYDIKSQTIDLSGNPDMKTVRAPATRYTKEFNLLETLPIRRLILDDTEFNRANAAQFKPNAKCEVVFK